MVDDDVSSSDEDEFMEADLVELEKTVLENIDRNLNETLTDEQVKDLYDELIWFQIAQIPHFFKFSWKL